MTNPNDPINPIHATFKRKMRYGKTGNLLQVDEAATEQMGLTKREYFAVIALQGVLAEPFDASQPKWDYGAACARAVLFADALIAQLNKESNP